MMKQLTVCIVCIMIVCFATQVFAMDLSKKRDIWDLHHISGTCIGTAYLNHVLEMPFWKAALTSVALGLAWEGLDELYYQGHFGKRTKTMDNIFDWRIGFDSKDLLRNGVGIAIAFPIRRRPPRQAEVRVPSKPYQK